MDSIEKMDAESGGVERQMPVVTVNPTADMERAELRQKIDDARISYRRNIAQFWCCMNSKKWNTKKSPKRSAAR
ncbi:MAG: hypothetical protein WDM80_13120 [Limisphaerales bacterium]